MQGGIAFAQTLENGDTIVLNTVVVSERPSVSAQSVPFPNSLERARTDQLNLSQYLNTSLPVYIKAYGSGGSASLNLRGTEARHSKLYWNGMMINSPALGQSDLSILPLAAFGTADLRHGSESLRDGAGAFGGSLHLNSLSLLDKPSAFSMNASLGSFGNYAANAKYGVSLGNRKRTKMLSAIGYKTAKDDYEYDDPFGGEKKRLLNRQFHHHYVLQLLQWQYGAHKLEAAIWYNDARRKLQPGIFTSNKEEWQHDRAIRSLISWRFYRNKGSHQLQLSYAREYLHYQSKSINVSDRSRMNVLTFRQESNFIVRRKMLLSAGLEFQNASAKVPAYNQKQGQSAVSKTLAWQWQFAKKWQLKSVLLSEWRAGNFLPLAPGLEVQYRPLSKPVLDITAGVNRNYNAPTLNDLYWVPGGNPDLEVEKAFQTNVAIALRTAQQSRPFTASARFGGYFTKVKEWIQWLPGNTGLWMPQNVKRVNAAGFEANASIKKRTQKWGFETEANYAFVHSVNKTRGDASYNKQLVYTPEHATNLNVKVSPNNFHIGIMTRAVGKRYTNTDNNEAQALSPYFLTDLNIAYMLQLKRLDMIFSASGNNLLNTQYEAVAQRPMPPRNFGLAWSLRVKS